MERKLIRLNFETVTGHRILFIEFQDKDLEITVQGEKLCAYNSIGEKEQKQLYEALKLKFENNE
ncbi:MAG: hypothetical protein ACRCXT_20495 [Paraclostridium sp.]